MEQLRGIKLKRFNRDQTRPKISMVIILDNLQYARNVAEVFRIADATKVIKIILTGGCPKPPFGKDLQKVSRTKERNVNWEYYENSVSAVAKLKSQGYTVAAVEITDNAQDIKAFTKNLKTDKIAFIVGNEVNGLGKGVLAKVDKAVYLPMFGKGASLNVAVSCAIAIYTLILANQS